MLTSDSLSDHLTRRRHALVHSASPRTWRAAALTLNRSNAAIWVPVRVGVALAVVLVIGGLAGRVDVAGFAALGALTSAFCRNDPYRIRLPRLAVTGGTLVLFVVFGGILGAAGASMPLQIVGLSMAAAVAVMVMGACRLLGPGPVVMIFAAAGAVGYATSSGDVVAATVSAAIGVMIGICASLAPWPYEIARGVRNAGGTSWGSVGADLRRVADRELLVAAARVALASAVAAGVAYAIGLSHPMWAAMGAIATLQGINFHLTVHRGVQRLIGNVVGGVLAAGLLAVPLGYWGAVVLVVIFQVAAELLVAVNYGLCSMAVTPMALLLTAMGTGLTPDVALDRMADTALGVVFGIVIAALTIARHDTAHHIAEVATAR